jgi:hypothetical protein
VAGGRVVVGGCVVVGRVVAGARVTDVDECVARCGAVVLELRTARSCAVGVVDDEQAARIPPAIAPDTANAASLGSGFLPMIVSRHRGMQPGPWRRP